MDCDCLTVLFEAVIDNNVGVMHIRKAAIWASQRRWVTKLMVKDGKPIMQLSH
jgi:hypothetical protein